MPYHHHYARSSELHVISSIPILLPPYDENNFLHFYRLTVASDYESMMTMMMIFISFQVTSQMYRNWHTVNTRNTRAHAAALPFLLAFDAGFLRRFASSQTALIIMRVEV